MFAFTRATAYPSATQRGRVYSPVSRADARGLRPAPRVVSNGIKGGFSSCQDFNSEYTWVTVETRKPLPSLPYTEYSQQLLKALVPRLLLADYTVPRFNESCKYFYIYEIVTAIVSFGLGKAKAFVCPVVTSSDDEEAVESSMDQDLDSEADSGESGQVQHADASTATPPPGPKFRSLMQYQLRGLRSGKCSQHLLAALSASCIPPKASCLLCVHGSRPYLHVFLVIISERAITTVLFRHLVRCGNCS